jgi:hypothetical protein
MRLTTPTPKNDTFTPRHQGAPQVQERWKRRKRAALIFASQKCRDRTKKRSDFIYITECAYEIAVACHHTRKSRDTPEKGKMASSCRFSGVMTPMTLCMTPS